MTGELEGSSAADQDKRPTPSQRVADALRSAIESGTYAVGERLPTYRELAKRHDVAVNTAMAAVRLLRDEGRVTINPNSRAYVRDLSTHVDTDQELRALRAELRDLRIQVRAAGADLAAIDERLSEVVARLSALET